MSHAAGNETEPSQNTTPLKTNVPESQESSELTIRKIKEALRKEGWSLEINDEWDRQSQNALIEFQKKKSLTPDKIVGEKTRAALNI